MARPVCARCTATIIMPPSSSIPTDTGSKHITALAKGESNAESARRLQPLATNKMPLEVPPPRGSRFGSPLVLSRVHWVRPELVVEVKYLAWTGDNLLRQVVYEGLREESSMRVCAKISLRPRCAARGDDHAADFGTPF